MRRHNRISAKVSGTGEGPRLAGFCSAKHIKVQLIDGTKGGNLVAAGDMTITKGTKLEHAVLVGKDIASKAKAKNITKVVFDRGGFLYAGRVKALADAAREGGLIF